MKTTGEKKSSSSIDEQMHDGSSACERQEVSVPQVDVQAVLSILLSTFAGFGVSMIGSSITVEVLRWRRRRHARANQNQIMLNPSRRSPTSHVATSSYGSLLYDRDVENPETFGGR